MQKDSKFSRRALLGTVGATAVGLPSIVSADGQSATPTPSKIGEKEDIAVYERGQNWFLYDKQNLEEDGTIDAYARPKPVGTSDTTSEDLDLETLETLIESEVSVSENGVHTNAYDNSVENSPQGIMPDISTSLGGDVIEQEGPYTDLPMYGLYAAFESPGVDSRFAPSVTTVVDFLCTLIDEFRGSNTTSEEIDPQVLPIPVIAAKVAAALKAMIIASSCSLILEPVAYGVLDGNTTMVVKDDTTFSWRGYERIPSVENATVSEYNTNEPWEDVSTGVLFAPARLQAPLETGQPQIPYYDWGSYISPS